MIRGGADAASLKHRADYLGIRLDIARVLCLVTPAEGQAVELPDAADRRGALRRCRSGERARATAVAEGVVVIVDLAADRPGAAAARTTKDLVAGACAKRSTRPGGCAQHCRPCAPTSRTTSAPTRRPAR